MKAAAKRKPFLEALSRAANIAPPKSTLPVLRTVLLQAEASGAIVLSTNNLQQALVEPVQGEVPEPGSVALPAKELLAQVSALSGEVVRLAVKDQKAEISDERKRRFRLSGLDAADYPPIPAPPEDAQHLVLQAADLAKAVGRVRHAACADTSRLGLCGVNLEIHDGLVRAVATDGHRLAVHGMALFQGEPTRMVLVPAAATELLETIAALGGRESMTLIWHESDARQVWLTEGTRRMCFALPNAEYPNWRLGMPDPGPYRARVPTPALIEVLNAIWAADATREHAVELRWSDNRLRVTLDAVDQGAHGEDSLPCETEGKEAVVFVRPRYLLEALRAADADVTLATGPGAATGADPLVLSTDDGYTEMIMPVVTAR